jgi:hypothetical protein
MREISVRDYNTHQKVQKKIKFYYDMLSTATTNRNPDITKTEVYNKIDGSDYKIAAFLTADLSRITTSRYTDQLSNNKPIIGAILMKEYNYGTFVKYEYVDIFTLLNTVFKVDNQIGMIKFNNSTKNFTEIDNSAYKQYMAYLEGPVKIHSANDIPVICINEESLDSQPMLKMIKEFISNTSNDNVIQYSYADYDENGNEEEIGFPIEQDYYLDMAFKNIVKKKCFDYIGKTVGNIKVLGQLKARTETNAAKVAFNNWRLLGFILNVVTQQRDYLDDSLKYHDVAELKTLTQNSLNGMTVLQNCMNWEILNLINKIATPDTGDILTRLEETNKLLEDVLNSKAEASDADNSIAFKSEIESLGTLRTIITVKGHASRQYSNEVAYRMLVPVRSSVKMAIMSEEVFNSLGIDVTGIKSQEVPINQVSKQNVYNFIKTVNNTMINMRVEPENYKQKGVLAKDLDDVRKIWDNVQKYWDNPVEFAQIVARKFTL